MKYFEAMEERQRLDPLILTNQKDLLRPQYLDQRNTTLTRS
jgi:hypothetical protein